MNLRPNCIDTVVFSCTAFLAALSQSHQNLVILAFEFLQLLTKPGSSSSGMLLFLSIAVRAPTLPPYPSANSAIFPLALRSLPFLTDSIGT